MPEYEYEYCQACNGSGEGVGYQVCSVCHGTGEVCVIKDDENEED